MLRPGNANPTGGSDILIGRPSVEETAYARPVQDFGTAEHLGMMRSGLETRARETEEHHDGTVQTH